MKSIICLLLVSALALISGNDLEETAKSVISKIHGSFGGQNQLNAFLDKSKNLKTTNTDDINKKDGILVAEGIGSIGGTSVTVARGRQSFTVSTRYGLGAAVLAGISDKNNSNALNNTEEELLKQELISMKKSFYEIYVQPIVDKNSKSNQTVVVVVENLNDKENVWFNDNNQINVKSVSGFILGTVTTVSQQNTDLKEIANYTLENIDCQFGGKKGQNNLKINDFIHNFNNNSNKKSQNSGYYGVGVGAVGVLSIEVYNGNNNVNISSLYGLRAVGLSGYKSEHNNTLNNEDKELKAKQMSQTLSEKYINPVTDQNESLGVLFGAVGEAKGEVLVATRDGYLTAGTYGTFQLGALIDFNIKVNY
ncbi:GATA zinc finger domain-containing protein 14-like [Oppia nitens]|uniref:GATA zinc finger domain-containing protein 14-like n=1 Tax=Oppia nitens TaxID=1686743 RepID=UPI0023D9942D|nr:GATA zinc finger domain-containing protein 14-like [Oppia nitens]